MLDVYANAEDGAAPRVIGGVRIGLVETLEETALPSVTEALAPLQQR